MSCFSFFPRMITAKHCTTTPPPAPSIWLAPLSHPPPHTHTTIPLPPHPFSPPTFIACTHLWTQPGLRTWKSPSTYLPTPHPNPSCLILIMQAAVSPLRWGPPGDSSTASDWGCATELDSSANGAEGKNANGSNQMKAEMRGGSTEERRRVLRGTPDQLSFRLRPSVCDRAYLLCLSVW